MGCDIHLFVEAKIDGKWVSMDKWGKKETGNPDQPFYYYVPYNESYYMDRNYDLFGILAGIRNGRGAAGIDMCDGFNPICMPKGLPEDCSPEVKRESDKWSYGGHSHSYLTLQELIDYNWEQVTKHRGVVNGPEFEDWNRKYRDLGEGPRAYSGGVFGRGVKFVTEDEMQSMIEKIKQETPHNWIDRIRKELADYYVKIEWEEPYFKSAQRFWSNTIPRLFSLAKRNGLSFGDVRIVFWFDG